MFGQSNSDSLPAYIKPNNQNITVTPTVTQQVFTADQDHTGLGTVTVNAVTSSIDQNITTENIKKDVSILGVTGSYEGSGGMDTVEATNYTESTISTGDKVWINQEGTNYKLVDFYKKYYNNFNVVGSPSIDRDSGYAGNFGSSSYLRLPEKFNPGNNTWEAVTCITTLSSIRTSKETHFFGCYTDDNSFVVTLKYISGSFYLTCYLSSDGSTFDISLATNTIPFTLGTKTWVKLAFTGTSYVLSSSTDGVNWTDTTITSSLSIAQNKYIYLGACWIPADSYLQGNVDLSQSYIKIGNDIWWTPVENITSGNITGDTLTGVADDNFTASSTSLNVNYPGSYIGTVLTSYVGNQTKANSTVTIYKNKSFECLFKVKKMDNNSGIRMFDCRKTNLTTYPAFYIRNGDSRIWAVANTSTSGSENYGYSYTIPNTNQWFYIKAYYDPSNLTVTYTWSYDKVTWTSIWSYTFSSSTWFNGNISEAELIMYIGSIGGSNEAWTGLTDLSECYFKVDDQIVWDGTTFTPGSTGDVEIGNVIEPTLGTKTITVNGTYNASSDNLDGFSSVTVDVPSAPTKKYNLLDRVKDDNNNEIGTVSGFFTDANGVEYAVVCLDAQYRLDSAAWCSYDSAIATGLPNYNATTWGPWEAKETATYNTNTILNFCAANSYTSAACNHCRTLSFTIDGTTYYGQLPNMIELNDIVRNHTALNTADTTVSSYSSVDFSTGRTIWSSSQYSDSLAWDAYNYGNASNNNKTNAYGIIPVLEIPL